MKKAIQVLILLSKIFSILIAIAYVTIAIISFVQAGTGPAEEVGGRVGEGIRDLFLASFAIGAIIVTYSKGPLFLDDTAEKADAILAIVFGALGCPFLAAAGIVYLVYLSVRSQPVEAEAIEEKHEEN